MKILLSLTALATALPFFPGCPRSTTVELVNDTDFPVEVRLFYDNDQEVPAELLEEFGNELEFTIPAGDTQTFSRDCEDFQAVMVHGDLMVAGNIGPSETTRVYRDGSDFGCDDIIRFTFTASEFATDLDISFSQRP